MKRIDHDGHERQGPPPFRVLPDTAYLSPVLPTPPPPRAPEPYKVVPSATRAQRRSTSFVILAESRPISPEAGGNAATLPAGRVSPFRGRGFKEPPPRLSVSRPQSPDTAGRRRGRVERRASASEQSSPRKSLIPQPTYRQRSTSLTKVNEQKTTERRGADSKARLGNSRSRPNVSGSQGRLNVPDARNARTPNDPRARPGRLESSRSSRPLAEPRTRFISNSTSDLNGGTMARRSQAAARSLLSPIQGTPTKPTEKATAGEAGARGRGSSRSSPTKTPNRSSPQKNATGREGASRGSRERVVSPSKIPVKTGKANGTSTELDERQHSDPAEAESQDKNLINLLRQTAAVNASGTSSERLVNTTTTTAVQPLQIDAVSSGPPTDVGPPTKEGASRSPASRDDVPPALVATSGAPNQSSGLPEGQSTRASAPVSDRRDGPRPSEGRAPTGSQSTARRREEVSSTASTETLQAKSGSAGRKITANREGLPEADKMLPTVTESEPRVASQERKATATTTTTTETTVGNAATNDATTADKAASSRESNPAPDAERASVNSRILSKNGTRGSQGSLGSTGMSVDSIMSYKSTDTGVSLNTFVRVSSPREKVGVHVMKRPQEIKTLSGDVVREEDGESEKKRRFMAPDGLKQRVRLPWWSKQRSRLRLWWIDWRSKRAQRRPTRISFEKTKTITDTPPPAAATPRSIGCRVCCCRRRASDNPPTEFLQRCRVCCCRRRASDNPPAEETKLPNPLVEHNSHMRGAIPCLPLPLAWFCLVWNVLLPGTGTIWSGLFNLCFGQPRFSPVAGITSRLGAFIINLVVGVSQMFTVLFCFVGWGWSIWWGITMIRLARKYKRFKAFEATRNDAEARAGDRVAPGVPTEVLRGAEKGR